MRVLILDHFDSFTWNLAHLAAACGATPRVLRVDRAAPADFQDFQEDLLLLSPGPGHPADALATLAAVRSLAGRVPILGVCLGMQILALAFGGRVGPAAEPVHGKASDLRHDGRGLFAGLPSPLRAARYHSLEVTGLPEDFEAQAWTAEGTVMAMRHRTWPMAAVQFHPESFLTDGGAGMMANALRGNL
ncbi:MAG: aminodeoxychorismate/anthranilate synthase component II [Acidobacteria bacterium]|nr:aminodeoxychorismate/anthranilate synthase component II [Acidobacteriota bacterium]